MEKQKLKELISLHKERFLRKDGLFARDAQEMVRPLLDQREIVVVTGVRRCGKSSLMRLVCADLMERCAIDRRNVLYLNFEDERFASLTSEDCERIFEAFLEIESPRGKLWFFLDEIQNVPLWEKWLNRLYEMEDAKIFVTGSNASLLGSEIATALTGRNRQLVVWPFSFGEFVRARGKSFSPEERYLRESRIELIRLFEEYLVIGGFPEAIKSSDPSILEQYYQDILYRDVIARGGVRATREIKELALFLASNAACVHSYKSLQDVIGVKSQNTVKSYLQSLSDVYLFLTADLFDYSLKRRIYNPSRIYGIDTALLQSVSFSSSRNRGRMLENLVFLESLRRYREVSYWRSKEGWETDFLVREGGRILHAFQVTSSLADPKTKEREMRGLLAARTAFSVDSLTILTEDEEGELERDGARIRIVPIWKWLLGW